MAQKSTVPVIRSRKVADGADPLVMLTAYDAPGARMVDEAGADLILVGDSVAMVVLGYEDTLQVTVADIAHHTAAVARTRPNALIVADLPCMSYHVSVEETVRNAATLIRAGAQSVKLEGGRRRLPMIEALIARMRGMPSSECQVSKSECQLKPLPWKPNLSLMRDWWM